MNGFSTAIETAKVCIEICERNGDFTSAFLIRERFHLGQPKQTCALLEPKDKNEDSSN
jgi:hypothetical protein